MEGLPVLDHVVINTRFEMDRAQPIYEELGFSLTKRGYHSHGSINHLMMFGDNFLELIGLPPGGEHQRPYIAAAPVGINGLVFKNPDVDGLYTHLQNLGMDGDPPNAFSRPVKLPEGEFPASFKTVTVRSDVFPAGRVYFCEHHTPHLIWRPEWQSHANGATTISEIVVVSEHFRDEAENFARLLNSEVEGDSEILGVPLSGSRITVLSPTAYLERFGELASPMAGRESIFGAMAIQTTNLNALREIAGKATSQIKVNDEPGRVVIYDTAFDSVLIPAR